MRHPVLVPEDIHRNGRPRPAAYLERAVFAAARHAANPMGLGSVEHVARARWNDSVTELVLRGATAPATTTAPAWAAGLAVTAVGDFIASLAPLSAAARLFEAAPRVSLDGKNLIQFPRRLGPIDPADVPWVVEAGPLPVLQYDVSGSATLGPTRKLAAIVVTTFETTESGAGEAVTRTRDCGGLASEGFCRLLAMAVPFARRPAADCQRSAGPNPKSEF
jgi:hypothetical protein